MSPSGRQGTGSQGAAAPSPPPKKRSEDGATKKRGRAQAGRTLESAMRHQGRREEAPGGVGGRGPTAARAPGARGCARGCPCGSVGWLPPSPHPHPQTCARPARRWPFCSCLPASEPSISFVLDPPPKHTHTPPWAALAYHVYVRTPHGPGRTWFLCAWACACAAIAAWSWPDRMASWVRSWMLVSSRVCVCVCAWAGGRVGGVGHHAPTALHVSKSTRA